MKSEVGLWIDHRKAVIVTVVQPDDGRKRLQADLEVQVRFSEGPSRESSANERRDYRLPNHLNTYYDGVIDCIRDAEFIQIFGPGEAMVELEKRLKHENPGGCTVVTEAMEKMTDRQIGAKVWQHFLSFK
jgi:hypothetical protein